MDHGGGTGVRALRSHSRNSACRDAGPASGDGGAEQPLCGGSPPRRHLRVSPRRRPGRRRHGRPERPAFLLARAGGRGAAGPSGQPRYYTTRGLSHGIARDAQFATSGSVLVLLGDERGRARPRRWLGEGGRSSASNNVGQARAVAVRAAGHSKRMTDLTHGTRWAGLILLVLWKGEWIADVARWVGSEPLAGGCVFDLERGELVEHFRSPCDRDGLTG